jgi:RNA polymerase-binding transcription factor
MPDPSHLSEADLARLRLVLARKREALLEAARTMTEVQRGVSDAEIENGDLAERMIEQDDALRLVAFDATLLADIDAALAKIEAGTYGVSEDSGAPIPLDRLEAVPWARRTLEEEELRQRSA